MVTGHHHTLTRVHVDFSEQLSPGIHLFGFRRDFDFRAGQVIGISVDKILVHGNRYLEQFHFYEEFREQIGEGYVRCCSGEQSDGVFHGRVTDFLAGARDLDNQLNHYLCGSAEMVVDTRDVLIARGIPFDRIISEIYF